MSFVEIVTVMIINLDCKKSVFFLKISKKCKVWRKSLVRAKRVRREKNVSPQSRSLYSASFQTFCLTARAYLNTQKTRTVLQSRINSPLF